MGQYGTLGCSPPPDRDVWMEAQRSRCSRWSDPVTHFDMDTHEERFFLGLVCIPLPKYGPTS